MHAISKNVSPVPGSGGVEKLEWLGPEPYTMHCLHTPTGLKILLTTSPTHPNCDALLRKVYEVYSDYALKNPFHKSEMPVRSELFETKLLQIFN